MRSAAAGPKRGPDRHVACERFDAPAVETSPASNCVAAVALAALFSIAVNFDSYAIRVFGVLAAGAVAASTLNAWFSPGADNSGPAILIPFGLIAGGMASTAVVL